MNFSTIRKLQLERKLRKTFSNKLKHQRC